MLLAELAEKAGLPGRTIRFYIARGLLPGPLKAGRGAAYGQEHLDRLREILTRGAFNPLRGIFDRTERRTVLQSPPDAFGILLARERVHIPQARLVTVPR